MSTNSTPLKSKVIPMRTAAKKASANFEEQLLSSSDEHPSSPFAEPSMAKQRVVRTYASKGRLRGSLKGRDVARATPSNISAAKPSKRRRPLHRDSGDSDGAVSDPLTPHSSPIVSSLRRTASVRKSLGTPLSTRTGATPAATPSAVDLNKAVDKWDLAGLESFVWVFINQRGELADKAQEGSDDQGDRMWWPGKISSSSVHCHPLRVSLIGEIFKEFSEAVEIASPSEHNILSMLTPHGNFRFDQTSFRPARTLKQVTESPRKRRKTNNGKMDIESKWQAAVAQMIEEHEIDNDGLPSVGLAYSDSLYGSARKASGWMSSQDNKVSKEKERRTSSPTYDIFNRWTPPPQDPMLMIPGELVLAREPKGTVYWPAKLEAYVQPKKSTQKPKYKVRYLDESLADIPRDFFFTSGEEEFGACKLGSWESSYKAVVNDEDGENDNSIDDAERGPSPIPKMPPPTPFGDLTMAEQFAYAKPVLTAILNDKYPPAMQRHNKFIKGGAARKSVTDSAGARGVIVPEDVDKLQGLLFRWALRDEQRAKRLDEEDAFPSETVAVPEPSTDHHEEIKIDTTTVGTPEESTVPSLSSNAEAAPSSPSLATESLLTDVEMPSLPKTPEGSGKTPDMTASETTPFRQATTESHRPPPRQRGCEAYEALSGVEKLEYCLNVLLPEAILQLLVWRSGDRHSLDILSQEEEDRLHELGRLKSQETDWVRDVMRLRERSQKRLPPAPVVSKSRTSRKSFGRG